jgi:hypothetical protein
MGREDEVRLIAYRIWEEEGCCQGRDIEHWIKAETLWVQQKQLEEKSLISDKTKKFTPKPISRKITSRGK